MPRIKSIMGGSAAFYRNLRDLTVRERRFLMREIMQARGLMPLLMKPRNGQNWTPQEKREFVDRLRRLSPYLVALALALPGGMLMLPALAWWLDRRRQRRPSAPVVQG